MGQPQQNTQHTRARLNLSIEERPPPSLIAIRTKQRAIGVRREVEKMSRTVAIKENGKTNSIGML